MITILTVLQKMVFFVKLGFEEAPDTFQVTDTQPFKVGYQVNLYSQGYIVSVSELRIQAIYKIDHTYTITSAIQRDFRTLSSFTFLFYMYLIPREPTKDISEPVVT